MRQLWPTFRIARNSKHWSVASRSDLTEYQSLALQQESKAFRPSHNHKTSFAKWPKPANAFYAQFDHCFKDFYRPREVEIGLWLMQPQEHIGFSEDGLRLFAGGVNDRYIRA